MPPAAKNLFEKRFLDLQKLLFKALRAYYYFLALSIASLFRIYPYFAEFFIPLVQKNFQVKSQ